VKVADIDETTHNPFDESHWVSCLRENLTSSSDGEGLETGRGSNLVPRQSFTRQLDLRHIKTTLGMEMLSCKTPEMVTKELWVYLLAYNLIRLLMAQAALLADQIPRQLSFKHTVQVWIVWKQRGAGEQDAVTLSTLLVMIAEQRVGKRPRRVEPRAIKRRPKPFPLLFQPRQLARLEIIENGHPQKVK